MLRTRFIINHTVQMKIILHLLNGLCVKQSPKSSATTIRLSDRRILSASNMLLFLWLKILHLTSRAVHLLVLLHRRLLGSKLVPSARSDNLCSIKKWDHRFWSQDKASFQSRGNSRGEWLTNSFETHLYGQAQGHGKSKVDSIKPSLPSFTYHLPLSKLPYGDDKKNGDDYSQHISPETSPKECPKLLFGVEVIM